MIIKIPKHLVEIFEIVEAKQEFDENCTNTYLCNVQNTDETSTSSVIDGIPDFAERENENPNILNDVLYSQYDNIALDSRRQCIGKQSFQCKQCGVEYDKKKQLLQHVRREHDSKYSTTKDVFSQNIFTCCMCDEQFRNLSKLSAHMKTLHSSERCYQCCQTYFFSMGEFIKHSENIHCQPSHYPCTKCTKVYTLFECLKTHLKVCQKGSGLYVTCELCGNVLKSKLGLEIHLLRHMREVYPCSECGKIFSDQFTMFRHRTKNHIMDFKCEVCFKYFHTFKGLKMHIRIMH